MKTKYEVPQIELVFFECGDIVTLSGQEEGPGNVDSW